MVYAFFDDSGHFRGTEDYLCLAGYLASEDEWNKFSESWQALLIQCKINAIHIRDLMALQGEYKSLNWTPAYRNEVLERFINVIKANLVTGFGIAVDVKYLRSLPESKRRRIGNPYYLCFKLLLQMVVKELHDWPFNAPLSMTFDDSDAYSTKILDLFIKLKGQLKDIKEKVAIISFADDTKIQPLQAADVLAWATNKDLRQTASGFGKHNVLRSNYKWGRTDTRILWRSMR